MHTDALWALRPIKRRHGLQWLAALPFMAQARNGSDVQAMLASDWPAGRSPEGFLVSEKYDGVRALWDGRQLRFRSGRLITAPPEWLAGLPAHPLDGELWLGYGEFDGLSGRVRRQSAAAADWRGVQYLVFDAPGQPGPFEARWEVLGRVIDAAGLPWLQRVAQLRVVDPQALAEELARVVRIGGEGLMLHRADASWQPGRSGALFKFKPERDAEALVLGYHKGQGRLAGMVGSLWVETPGGQRFSIGSGLSDADRRAPPPVGSWVTYRYRELTPGGIPRFASFVRLRAPE